MEDVSLSSRRERLFDYCEALISFVCRNLKFGDEDVKVMREVMQRYKEHGGTVGEDGGVLVAEVRELLELTTKFLKVFFFFCCCFCCLCCFCCFCFCCFFFVFVLRLSLRVLSIFVLFCFC